jgi:hypothetical protein
MLWKLSVTTIIFIVICCQTAVNQGSKCDTPDIKDLDAAELSALSAKCNVTEHTLRLHCVYLSEETARSCNI